MYPQHLGQQVPQYSADHVRFFNLMLEMDRIRYTIDPILESVCANIEFAYKSPAKIDFISAAPSKSVELANCVQYDEICVRLLHLESDQDFFLTMESRLARTLLSRLLASSLVDESPHLLFSSTEKGIFNFILARLLGEMKKALQERMPNLKILGIFHAVDHVIKDFTVAHHGACNFVLNFAADHYHVVLFCPRPMLELGFTRAIKTPTLYARAGHIKHNLSFIVYKLKISAQMLQNLAFGDLIIFDHATLTLNKNKLEGNLCARWADFTVPGHLSSDDNSYCFVFKDSLNTNPQDDNMEEIEITGAKSIIAKNQLASLARNLRISVSIELSRVPLSLQELCELKPGEIVNLHRKLEDPLEIVVEGKVIGFCTPVQIDGRLGIKILNIDGNHEAHDEN